MPTLILSGGTGKDEETKLNKLFGRLLDKPLLTAKLFAVIFYRVSYEDPPT